MNIFVSRGAPIQRDPLPIRLLQELGALQSETQETEAGIPSRCPMLQAMNNCWRNFLPSG